MYDWKKYQFEIANYFKKLGCKVKIEEIIPGARYKHEIDVWVIFKQFGFNIKWAIECKYWNKKIPKSEVLNLKGKIDDIGVDKGFIISELGFQKGAFAVSKNTNIKLMTFKDLKKVIKKDLYKILIKKLEIKVNKLEKMIINKLNKDKRSEKKIKRNSYKDFTMYLGYLQRLRYEFEEVKKGRVPKSIIIHNNSNIQLIYPKDILDYTNEIEKIIRYWNNQINS